MKVGHAGRASCVEQAPVDEFAERRGGVALGEAAATVRLNLVLVVAVEEERERVLGPDDIKVGLEDVEAAA